MATKVDKSHSLLKLLSKEDQKGIKTVYDKTQKHDEFEIMFYNYKKDNQNKLRFERFLDILTYMNNKSISDKNVKVIKTTSLDISYAEKDTFTSFRITITGQELINKYIQSVHTRRNHIIFQVLLTKYIGGDKNITLIKKTKERDSIYDVDDLDLRVRLSKEQPVLKKELDELTKLSEITRQRIMFRYKQRATLIIHDDKDGTVQVDLTGVKMNRNINALENSIMNYELEAEYVPKTSSKLLHLNKLYSVTEDMLKILQQSNYIVTKSKSEHVLNTYHKSLSLKEHGRNLHGRRATSLEIQHVVDTLPNRYAVTDKADGERNFLIIVDNEVYLISYNLHVVNTGVIIPHKKSNYNNSILDGELIFLPNKNRHVFLAFDCLTHGSTDMRSTIKLFDRIEKADDIILNCFVNSKHNGPSFKKFGGTFSMKNIMAFHENEITNTLKDFKHDVDIDKDQVLIRRKYFIGVDGFQANEIFKFSKLMWNKYVLDKTSSAPYLLDGLVYHPLNQSYDVTGKSKLIEYKWKPPSKNSIDFYIKFARDKENKILTLYDNSNEDHEKWKPYRICYLYVGFSLRGEEKPILFLREENKHAAYLYLNDGDIRDVEGNVVQDKTVVEFYYNHDPDTPEEFRWIPIRTRFDKTESVRLYKRKYGNNSNIAKRIWRSITNPFIMKDIEILSNDKEYANYMNILRGKVDHSLIVSERRENEYYQIKTWLAKPLRDFHNWIKSNIIYTHFNQAYEYGKRLTVLDIASGRGGDIQKFYYCKILFYVGVELDISNIMSAADGAVSRYRQLKKTHEAFPPFHFINGDGSALLTPEDQLKAMGNTSDKNMTLMKKFFSADPSKRTLFDRMTCMFAIHYFLENDTTWNNYCTNINMYLKPGGYFICTTYDAEKVIEVLKETGKFATYYTNKKGEKKIFHDIIKRYGDIDVSKPIGLGNAIDVHNSMISFEGVYNTEYLVDKKFLEQQFEQKCNMELVETDLFWNIFESQRDNFKHIVQYESAKTVKYLTRTANYYDDTDSVNRASYPITKLNRYYVFRKRDSDNPPKNTTKNTTKKNTTKNNTKNTKKNTKKNNKQSGGASVEFSSAGLESLDQSYMIKKITCQQGQSFCHSIYDVLQHSSIVPKNLSINDFYNSIDANIYEDDSITTRKIGNINRRLQIGHTSGNTSEVVLDGLNIIVFKPDCDGEEKKIYNRTKKKIDTSRKSVMILYNGSDYQPIYKVSDEGMKSIFDTNSKDITDLV